MNTSTDTGAYHDNPIFKELVSILGNGFILSLFTIDFFCFEYVLPILGSLIMLYGCHLVKEHSIYFKWTYRLALVRFLTMLGNFMIDWTKLHDNRAVTYLQITIAAILIISIFFCMNRAFRDIYEKAGAADRYNNRLGQYNILYLCTIAATYLTIHLGILGAMLSLFILILNIAYLMLTFYQLGMNLSKLDATLTLSYYTVSEKKQTALLLGVYGVLLSLTVIFANKALFLPIHSSSQLGSEKAAQNETEKKLLDLGLDKTILADLPEQDVLLLDGATSLICDTSVKEINNGSLQVSIYDFTCKEDHRILVYYKWLTEPDSRLYQIIECEYPKDSAATSITSKAYVKKSRDQKNMVLPNINLGTSNRSYPYTQHKLSNMGTDLRGYLSFSYEPSKKTIAKGASYTINYYYQASVFNLPYLNIIDYMNHYKEHTSSIVFDKVSLSFHLK